VSTGELFEITAHSLTAVLGVWLGLTVITRSQGPGGRLFAALSLTLAVWSSAIIVNKLSESETAATAGRNIEELAAALVIPATAHLALVIASEGHPRPAAMVESPWMSTMYWLVIFPEAGVRRSGMSRSRTRGTFTFSIGRR
jgi:hypothetical protein